MKKNAILIGRFQPFHNAHLELTRFGLKNAEKLFIIVGSANSAPTVKNPWSAETRQRLITLSLTREEKKRITFFHAKDYKDNEVWETAIKNTLEKVIPNDLDDETILIGHRKDTSSFYLDSFPKWEFLEAGKGSNECDATLVRSALFNDDFAFIKNNVPEPVFDFLFEFSKTEDFYRLQNEFLFENGNKQVQNGCESVSIVLTKASHILLCKRSVEPGLGLFALPSFEFGGKIHSLADLVTYNLRYNVFENFTNHELLSAIKSKRANSMFFALSGNGALPKIKRDFVDSGMFWLELRELFSSEHKFFDDHFHIAFDHLVKK